jgi:hypothetical protein
MSICLIPDDRPYPDLRRKIIVMHPYAYHDGLASPHRPGDVLSTLLETELSEKYMKMRRYIGTTLLHQDQLSSIRAVVAAWFKRKEDHLA